MNKKNIVTLIVILLVSLGLIVSPAAAGPASEGNGPQKTPGVKETSKAVERATERATEGTQKPTGQPGGKPQDKEERPGKADAGGKKTNFKGTLTAVSATRLTLQTDAGEKIEVSLEAAPRIGIPTLGKSAQPGDLVTGAQVIVQAVQGKDGAWVARHVLVIPGKPVTSHHVGVVSQYTPGASLALVDDQGATYTFKLNAQTRIQPTERAAQLKVGARVTLIFARNPTGGAPEVRGVVVHGED